MSRFSIKTRLIAALALILLSAFTVLSVLNYQTSRSSMREEIISSSLPLIRENIYSEIHASLVEPILVSTTMAHDAFLRSWVRRGERDVNQIIRYLEDIHSRYGYFSTFFVSENTRRYYHYKGVHKAISPDDGHDVWYFNFLRRHEAHELVVDTDEVTGGVLTIFINHRVEDYDGSLLGVTGVGVRMDTVAGFLKRTQDKYARRVYLVDEEGLVQAHPDLDKVRRMSIRTVPGLSRLATDILALREQPRNFEYQGPDGPVLLTASYVPELQWFVIVEQDEAEALAASQGNLKRTMAGGFLATVLAILVSTLAVNHFQSRLEHMAVTDELTGAANRRRFDEQFALAQARHAREGTPVSVILFDLDGFKAVNDRAGHLEGDRVLRGAAEAIQAEVRPMDLVARWGGDEFVVLAESGLGSALEMAERIRRGVLRAELGAKGVPCVSVSAGVAEYAEGEDLDQLMARADAALYQAKQQGRDTVCPAGD